MSLSGGNRGKKGATGFAKQGHPFIHARSFPNIMLLIREQGVILMSGYGGFFNAENSVGVILVLFILLTVIACSCGAFSGYGGGAV